MPRLSPDDDLADQLEEGRAPADPEPRREHQQADTGRHDEDRSRPASFTRKMH